jgi:hypothetical protein
MILTTCERALYSSRRYLCLLLPTMWLHQLLMLRVNTINRQPPPSRPRDQEYLTCQWFAPGADDFHANRTARPKRVDDYHRWSSSSASTSTSSETDCDSETDESRVDGFDDDDHGESMGVPAVAHAGVCHVPDLTSSVACHENPFDCSMYKPVMEPFPNLAAFGLQVQMARGSSACRAWRRYHRICSTIEVSLPGMYPSQSNWSPLWL